MSAYALSGQKVLDTDASNSHLLATDCPGMGEGKNKRSSKEEGTLEIILQMMAQREP